jgi:flagellar biosynthetic protein FliR
MFEFLFQTDTLLTFIMVFFRISGIIFSAPMFSSQLIPNNVKIAVSLVLAVVVAPTVQSIGLSNINPLLLILLIAKEILLGIATGMMAQLLFVGVQIGGELAGFQMGFSMVNSFDPSMNMQLSIIAQLKKRGDDTLFYRPRRSSYGDRCHERIFPGCPSGHIHLQGGGLFVHC